MSDVDQLGLDLGYSLGLLMRRFYAIVLESAYGDASTTLSVDVTFDLANPLIQATLDDLALLVANVTETTRNDIRAVIGEGAAQGWGTAQLSRALRDRGLDISPARATLISRTEAARAYSAGALLAYAQSGAVSGVQWLLGPSPCVVCQPLGGKIVTLGDAFPGGFRMPPDPHPGCTCALAPVIERSAQRSLARDLAVRMAIRASVEMALKTKEHHCE